MALSLTSTQNRRRKNEGQKKKKVVIGALFIVLMLLNGMAFAETKVIHVWHTETNPKSRAAIANIVSRFEKLHPDIKVEAEALAWGDLEGKIMAALAAGSPPELSHGQPITCAALQAKGLLLPLDDVVQSIGEDNIWSQIKKVGKFGDHYYGLVHAAGTSLLIYRKDLVKQKDIQPPKTWDDLLKIAEQLTMDTNGDGKTDIYGMTIPGDNLFINISWASSSKRTAARCLTKITDRALRKNRWSKPWNS